MRGFDEVHYDVILGMPWLNVVVVDVIANGDEIQP